MKIKLGSAWADEKVCLFLLEEGHASEDYVNWLNNKDTNRFLESRFTTHTKESTQQFIKNCLMSQSTLLLGIQSIEHNSRHIGNIKLELNRAHALAEVGIMIGDSSVHGKGFATSAIKVASKMACKELGIRKLSAGCYRSNIGSQKAFSKAGFQIEAVRPKHFLLNDRAEDLILMGLIL